MINAAIALVLLLACASIVVLRFVGWPRPPQSGSSAGPAESRTTLAFWPMLAAVLGIVIAAARLRAEVAAAGSQGPVDGLLLVVTLVILVAAIGLWALRTYWARTAR